MMTALEMYMILKLDDIQAVFIGTCVLLFLVAIFSCMIEEEFTKTAKKFIIAGIIFVFVTVWIPSTSQFTKMKIYPILVSEKGIKGLKKIPPKLLKILDLSLEKLEKAVSK